MSLKLPWMMVDNEKNIFLSVSLHALFTVISIVVFLAVFWRKNETICTLPLLEIFVLPSICKKWSKVVIVGRLYCYFLTFKIRLRVSQLSREKLIMSSIIELLIPTSELIHLHLQMQPLKLNHFTEGGLYRLERTVLLET